MRSIVKGEAARAGIAPGPVPFAGFRSVEWQGKTYWFRTHERPWVRCLFLLARLGRAIWADELPGSLRDTDAWGELIVQDAAGLVRLAAVPTHAIPR